MTDKYNTGAMMDSASDVLQDKKKLDQLIQDCSKIAKEIQVACQDENGQNFGRKFEAYKPTMEAVSDILQAYADYLNSAGNTINEFITRVLRANR